MYLWYLVPCIIAIAFLTIFHDKPIMKRVNNKRAKKAIMICVCIIFAAIILIYLPFILFA